MSRSRLLSGATGFGIASIFYLINEGFLSGMLAGALCVFVGVFGEELFGDSKNQNH